MIKKKISEIADISSGYQFRKSPPEFSSGLVHYIQMRDIDVNNNINIDSIINIDVDIESESFSSKALKKNDLLFKNRGSKNTAAIFTMDSNTAIATHQFLILRIKNDKILPEFLKWYLNNEIAQVYFKFNATGTVTPIIQKKVLEEMEIVIPAQEEQKKIIKIDTLLSKYTQSMKKQIKNYTILTNTKLNNYLKGKKDKQ